MGLDLVGLVLAVEDRFGITLSDDEAIRAETPGKLGDLIYSRLSQPGTGGCITSQAFYSVRKALMELSEWNRAEVVPMPAWRNSYRAKGAAHIAPG